MKNVKNLMLAFLAVAAMTLTGCLHILEELTVKSDGSGTYSMTMDMSEMKSMMDMFQGMAEDSLSDGAGGAGDTDPGMGEMGSQLSAVAQSLEGVSGIANVQEIK